MTALNKFFQLRKLFAEARIVTEAIYDVRESDNCAWTFETHFISSNLGFKLNTAR